MEFGNLRYDLSKVEKGKRICDTYPEILSYEEFAQGYDELRMRWLILTVDHNSPFYELYGNDFKERSSAVYKYLKINDKKLLAYISNRFDCDYQTRVSIDGMIYKYFMLMDNINYNTWYTEWVNFHELNALLRIPINPLDEDYDAKTERKQKTSRFLSEKQRLLAGYEKRIFGDTKIKQVIVDQVAKMVNWPEKMARTQEINTDE